MPDQAKTATRTADKHSKPAPVPWVWGVTTREILYSLKEQTVQIAFLDGKTMTAELVGVDQFDLILRQGQGAPVIVPKHGLKWIAKAPSNGSQATANGKAPNA